MKTIKLAIAEDHLRFRETLSNYLSSFESFEVVIEAENGQELLDKLIGSSVDIVILDIRMPVLNGIETLKLLKVHFPAIKVIMFSSITDQPVLIELSRLGANSFVCKYEDISVLINAIEEVNESGHSLNTHFKNEFLLK
jgi:DNA-binding NarL/FixJ family response regulator